MDDVPAGWYPIPDDPNSMRYWDGNQWTEHVHTFDHPVGLGSIGQMVSEAFDALGKQITPIIVLSLVVLVVPNFIATYMTERALDGFSIFVPDSGDFEVTGFGTGTAITLAVFTVLPYFFTTLHSLAITWLILRSEHSWGDGESDSWTSALGPALRAAPRVLIVLLLTFVCAMVGAILAITIGALVHPATLVLTVPGAVVLLVWIAVKMAPLQVAALAAPKRPILPTSAAVSEGRFFAVLGRLIILAMLAFMLVIAASVVSTVLGGVLGGGPELDVTDNSLVILGTSGIPALIVQSILSAVSSGVTGAVFASGLITIYRNAGGPFERNQSTNTA